MKDILEQLSNSFPFSVLSKKELEQIAEDASELDLANSETLFQPGSPRDALYLVLSGGVKLTRNNPGKGKLIMEIFGPGEIIIEESFSSNSSHSSEARPLGEAKVLKISHKLLNKIFESNSKFLLAWLEMVSRWLSYYQERLEAMVFQDVNQRLANALVSLAKKFGKKDQRGTLISLKITHQELSEYIAASRETVSLALSDLRKKKLLQTKMRWLVIPDLKALRKRTE